MSFPRTHLHSVKRLSYDRLSKGQFSIHSCHHGSTLSLWFGTLKNTSDLEFHRSLSILPRLVDRTSSTEFSGHRFRYFLFTNKHGTCADRGSVPRPTSNEARGRTNDFEEHRYCDVNKRTTWWTSHAPKNDRALPLKKRTCLWVLRRLYESLVQRQLRYRRR